MPARAKKGASRRARKRQAVLKERTKKHLARIQAIQRAKPTTPPTQRRMIRGFEAKHARKALAYATKAAMDTAGIRDRDFRKKISETAQKAGIDGLEHVMAALPPGQEKKFWSVLTELLEKKEKKA